MGNERAGVKTLTLENTTFEIVDAKARELLGNVSVGEQISQATKSFVTEDRLEEVEKNMVTEAHLNTVTSTISKLEQQVEEKVMDTEQLQTDLQTYVDEQIKLVKPDHIDDGEI